MKILLPLLLLLSFISCKDNEKKATDIPTVEPSKHPAINYHTFIGKDFLVDDQHSYIGFKIKYFGFSPVRGRFNKFWGTVFYDTTDISTLSVSFFVDVNSINTGNETRDKDLKSTDTWFNAPAFPNISFQSKNIVKKADGGFDLVGNLTIKGIQKEITINFDQPTDLSNDWAGNEQVDFSGKVTINRQDFKVYGGDFWSSVMENGLTQLSDEVEIEIDIHTRRANYQKRYNDDEATNLTKIVLNRIRANGIATGLQLMDSLFTENKLSAGKCSSIGYTLNTWEMHEAALNVFQKRKKLFPKKINTTNQLGITNLYLNKIQTAKQHFNTTLEQDSINDRAIEYLKLIEHLNTNKAK